MLGWRSAETAEVREVTKSGYDYLEFPIIAAVEGVLEYEDGKEFLPRSALEESADAGLWNGTPLTFRHPQNRRQSARDADAYSGEVIGAVFDPTVIDGKLRVRALLDESKARAINNPLAGAVVDRLLAGEELSVSAAYGVDETARSGRYEGEQYEREQTHIFPDHVAVFPSDEFTARCSIEDGCAAPRANGIRANCENADCECNSMKSDEEIHKLVSFINQHMEIGTGDPLTRDDFQSDDGIIEVAEKIAEELDSAPFNATVVASRDGVSSRSNAAEGDSSEPRADRFDAAVATRSGYEARKNAEASDSHLGDVRKRELAARAKRFLKIGATARAERLMDRYGWDSRDLDRILDRTGA